MLKLKHRFRIALAYAGLNQSQWAKLHGIQLGNINPVLSGEATSAPIIKAVEDFVAALLPRLAKELTEAA